MSYDRKALQTCSGRISNIQRGSLEDGPGVRTVVFLKGCPLRCRWCHNPETMRAGMEIGFNADPCIGCGECVRICPNAAHRMEEGGPIWDRAACSACGKCVEVCPSGALYSVGSLMEAQAVLSEVHKDEGYYQNSGGGMTLSGGEPLAQVAFSEALLILARENGVHTVVETCGYAKRADVLRVLALADMCYYDIKHVDPLLHRKYTGVDNRLILENLKAVAGAGISVIVRVPVIPGMNDHPEHICRLREFLQTFKQPVSVELLPYHELGESKYRQLGRAYKLEGLEAPEARSMEDAASRLRTPDISVSVR
ncbi:MAG: glycyl-radical enzyme activating protein [Candidatus Latescibacteria bacterium]|nr:glycyl-radical enzyme activating protein [Candidatus Latescibacterota bacterium]MCK5526104.1 glycyl-radical enzyme activating protein [Candidatus Latescibacterota bacterium]